MATGSPILFDAQWKGLLIQFLTLGQHLMDLIRQHLFHDTFISKQKVEMVGLCFEYLCVVSHISQQGNQSKSDQSAPSPQCGPNFAPTSVLLGVRCNGCAEHGYLWERIR